MSPREDSSLAQQFALHHILRITPPAIFRDYLQSLGVPFHEPREGDPKTESIQHHAWGRLTDSQQKKVEADLRRAHELADADGLAIIHELANLSGEKLAPDFDALEGQIARILWVRIHHPDIFESAVVLNHSDTLNGRYWRTHADYPKNDKPKTDDKALKAFGKALSAFYKERQGRGKHCTVEHYLRADNEHYYFAYPDDHADLYVSHDESGKLNPRPERPTFQNVFAYAPRKGSLDLFAPGGKAVHCVLVAIFAKQILGVDYEDPNSKLPVYKLNILKQLRGALPTDSGDGIERAMVRSIAITPNGKNGKRITLEAGRDAKADDVWDMMDNWLDERELKPGTLDISRASFSIKLANKGAKAGKSLSFDVTAPSSCNLKSKSEEMRLLGEKCLRKWGILP